MLFKSSFDLIPFSMAHKSQCISVGGGVAMVRFWLSRGLFQGWGGTIACMSLFSLHRRTLRHSLVDNVLLWLGKLLLIRWWQEVMSSYGNSTLWEERRVSSVFQEWFNSCCHESYTHHWFCSLEIIFSKAVIGHYLVCGSASCTQGSGYRHLWSASTHARLCWVSVNI